MQKELVKKLSNPNFKLTFGYKYIFLKITIDVFYEK